MCGGISCGVVSVDCDFENKMSDKREAVAVVATAFVFERFVYKTLRETI